MNTMNVVGIPVEKVETLKDIIETINSINNEMNAQLRMIMDALAHVSRPSDEMRKAEE